MNEWYGEQLMKELLDFWFSYLLHHDNYRPDWLKVLELDRYYPSLELAFEFQGIQHYTYTPEFHATRTDFEKQKERDELKQQLCRENNVILIPINHNSIRHMIFRKTIRRYVPPAWEKHSLIVECVAIDPPERLCDRIRDYSRRIETSQILYWDLPDLKGNKYQWLRTTKARKRKSKKRAKKRRKKTHNQRKRSN